MDSRPACLVVALALAGCDSTPPTAVPDATVDVTVDGTVDATVDVTVDGTVDATVDGTVDGAAPVGCAELAGPFAPLSTRCGQFVDAQGRVVVLTGINARVQGVFDQALDMGRALLEAIPPFTMDDALRMRSMGFNLLRLPIQWSGVEPTETGGFDEGYLDRVAAAVTLARSAGLLVLLDFHQDAYSKEIGEDGAPRWAIVPPPDTLLGGPLTDLGARRSSTQVLRAFGTFFGDGTDGDRLRLRFAQMAGHVAARFAHEPAVMGYEVFNEPQATPDQLLRVTVQTATAMRAADPARLVVFEPDVVFREALNHSVPPRGVFPLAGGVYAPHTYPLAFGGSMQQLETFTRDTLAPATVSARDEATQWATPLLITEWGYGPQGVRAAEYYRFQTELQDQVMASAVFWLWKEQSEGLWGLFDWHPDTMTWTERVATRQALLRVHPEAIAGWPEHWGYDHDARRFELAYTGAPTVTAPTRVYIPAPEDFTAAYTVTCDARVVTAARDAATGVVEVPCTGAGEHTVVVAAR